MGSATAFSLPTGMVTFVLTDLDALSRAARRARSDGRRN